MPDPERQELLRGLGELSAAFPELRFGQMIANLAVVARGATTESIWDVEDDELLAARGAYARLVAHQSGVVAA